MSGWVNNSGMSLWEALLPLGLVLALVILAAVGTGLALGEIIAAGPFAWPLKGRKR